MGLKVISCFCAGLRVQTWTEYPRFPSYCPKGCEPRQYNFAETINVKKIKIPGTDIPEWRAEDLGPHQVSAVSLIQATARRGMC